MNTIMKLDKLNRVEQMRAFLAGTQAVIFTVATSKDECYRCIEDLLQCIGYTQLKRQEKGIVMQFLMKISGYSRQQLTRLIHRYCETGKIKRQQKTTNGFNSVYTANDIQCLVEIDKLHDTPNGLRVKKLCERAYCVFKDAHYQRLSQISVSHIYNLRKSNDYKRQRCHYEKTKSYKGVAIGQRRKPQPNGKPGYIRIDTVHQGDLDKVKGVYHINAVDEVTQFEVVATVEKISEYYLIPALEVLLDAFPFEIINFHSDNGSEYVNNTVAKLLSKLLVEFTKSRPRHSNDNALAEGKNASVVRKMFGYEHIPQRYANQVNQFNQDVLNPYVNYHRPCLYPTTFVNKKGKQKKKYKYENMTTPYEKLKSLPNAKQYLREGISFNKLDDFANRMSDNEAARYLQKQRRALFKQIHEDCQECA